MGKSSRDSFIPVRIHLIIYFTRVYVTRVSRFRSKVRSQFFRPEIQYGYARHFQCADHLAQKSRLLAVRFDQKQLYLGCP